MSNKTSSYTMDMTTAPLFKKIIVFTVPLILSNLMQLLFNAADMIIVGKFAGADSLSAVGATGSLINMLVSVFMGLSIGANVLVAKYYAAKNDENVSKTVHTAILLSIIAGIILGAIGITAARKLLELMSTPADIIDKSTLYVRIYFIGIPINLLYNYGSAILRAVGDTKRPLYYLLFAGLINCVLNIIFVIGFGMTVDGVAIATIISQAVSAFLVIRSLMRSEESFRLSLNKLQLDLSILKKMLLIGLPAGFQGTVFSLSNVVIQSSVNSFGSLAVAGSSAAANIEGFVYVTMNSFYHSCLNFTSQNVGAGKNKNISKILAYCIGCVTVTGAVLGISAYMAGDTLLMLYIPKDTVAAELSEILYYGKIRMAFVCLTYYLCGIMDVCVGSLRGLGYSIMPMIVSLAGACGFRLIWIATVFSAYHTFETLFVSYPLSWALTSLTHIICFMVVKKNFPVKTAELTQIN